MELLLASQRDDLNLVQDLLDRGYSVNSQNEDGVTPLQVASACGQMATVCFLISKGADIDMPNHYGWTPLIHSFFHGHEDIARLFLQKGAKISACTKLGLSPFSAACSGGHLSCVRLLLEHDSVTFLQELQGLSVFSPILAAALHGHDDLIKLLMDHDLNINQAHNLTKLTALMLAASNGQRTSVQTLVEHGADPNLTNIIQGTALDIASACGKWEVKAYLGDKTITQNICQETKRKEREEPIILAVKQGNMKELHRLLDMDPDACNRWSPVSGLSPLMQAAISGHEEAATLLLKKGAKINAQEKENKWTALMFAVFHRKNNVVSVLLDGGADIEIRACNDCTALELVWVSDGGPKDLIELFTNSKSQSKLPGSSTNTQLSTTLKSDSKRTFLRRSSGNSSFRAWMTSRFQHLRRSRSSNSLSAASPTLTNEGMSDEDDETIVFLPEKTSTQQPSQNTKWLKLSSLHFLKRDMNKKPDWITKQVHPPVLPSPSKWHSPLPKEFLPPLVIDAKEQNFKPPKAFCPVNLLKHHNNLQKEMRAELWAADEDSGLSAIPRSPRSDSLPTEGPTSNWSGIEAVPEIRISGEDDVQHLLQHLSLDRYIPQFQAHEIDLEALKGVTEQDLQEIGVHSIGPRQQLIAAISHLQ